jgi:hypothetical protein
LGRDRVGGTIIEFGDSEFDPLFEITLVTVVFCRKLNGVIGEGPELDSTSAQGQSKLYSSPNLYHSLAVDLDSVTVPTNRLGDTLAIFRVPDPPDS